MTEAPEEPDLLAHAQRVAAESVTELEDPDDDILPVFIWFGPHGVGLMPLVPMTDGRSKDQLAAAMTAALVVGRATQAVFSATSWVVEATRNPDETGFDPADPLTRLMPSEHPDRKECLTIMHHKVDGGAVISQAILTRYPDRIPTLGEWRTTDQGDAKIGGGRFGEAINAGLEMARGMPQEMADIIEAGWAAGEQEELLQSFLNAYGQVTGVTGFGVEQFRQGEGDDE
jgi:hypothetical protein